MSDAAPARVLVPRGGEWGERAAAALRRAGAEPLVEALIEFAPPADETSLADALHRLAVGGYDWVVVTSATAVRALTDRDARVPSGTRVAAVGQATAAAVVAAGWGADPALPADESAAGLLAGWPALTGHRAGLRVLLPAGDLAAPLLADGLRADGHAVDAVVAYRTVTRPVPSGLADDLRAGRVDAVLVGSGSVARALVAVPPAARTLVACLGPRTAADARAARLRVDVVAAERSVEALVDALVTHLARQPAVPVGREPAVRRPADPDPATRPPSSEER